MKPNVFINNSGTRCSDPSTMVPAGEYQLHENEEIVEDKVSQKSYDAYSRIPRLDMRVDCRAALE